MSLGPLRRGLDGSRHCYRRSCDGEGIPRYASDAIFGPDDHAKRKLGVGVALHIVERRVTRVSSGKVITR